MAVVDVNPRCASIAASTPLCAALPGWNGLVMEPKTSRTPEACVPATPIAWTICSVLRCSRRPAAATDPKTPHVPVMCQPSS